MDYDALTICRFAKEPLLKIKPPIHYLCDPIFKV